MIDIAKEFRAQLSAKLKEAAVSRDKDTINTIRSLMSLLDNASAIPKEELAKLDASVTEVPRKQLRADDIKKILQSEVDARIQAMNEYERLKNSQKAEEFRKSIGVIKTLLNAM